MSELVLKREVSSAAVAVGSVLIVVQLWLLFFASWQPLVAAATFLTMVLVLAFWTYPSRHVSFDLALSALAFVPVLYMISDYDAFLARSFFATGTDALVVLLLLALIFEAGRRAAGWVLPAICLALLAIVTLGNYLTLPGLPSVTEGRLLAMLGMTDQGIFGGTLRTAAKWIFIFLIYGQVLQMAGAKDLFTRVSSLFVRRFRGGSGYATIVASMTFGSISGSNVANVIATGRFTIPQMMRAGVPPVHASSIETVASTGGALVPPIMGAAAFLIAEYTSMPYAAVLKAALVPAALYYLTLWIYVWSLSGRLGLERPQTNSAPLVEPETRTRLAFRSVFVLGSIGWIVFRVLERHPLEYAAVEAIGICLLGVLVTDRDQFKPTHLRTQIASFCVSASTVVIACALAGVITGTLYISGSGLGLARAVGDLGERGVLLALLAAMVVVIILGLGVPGIASYIIGASLLVTPLVNLGFDPIGAHLFIYFFALFAGVTPPVAITAFAAAGIYNHNANRVGWRAFWVSIPLFLIPFFVMTRDGLLLNFDSWSSLLSQITVTAVGLMAFAVAVAGWLRVRLSLPGRVAAAVVGVMLSFNVATLTVIGFALLATLVVLITVAPQRLTHHDDQDKAIDPDLTTAPNH
ncbi:TRAP transporter permease [Aeromicrobium sp. CTD01-1L150]|uniref:TRAP transporter permease n=1 Tax=Aeromicrobium sp. CTD01-1L150 TaxID=3341830 RepID=UPI0035C111F1